MKSDARKRHVWDFFEMSLRGEVDPALTSFHWDKIMFPMTDLLGPALVWAVGFKALEYPPTWADTQYEADLVEAAINKYLNEKEM